MLSNRPFRADLQSQICWKCGEPLEAGARECVACGSLLPDAPAVRTLEVGDCFADRFRIESVLAHDEVGARYKVYDETLEISLCLVVIDRELTPAPEAVREFRRTLRRCRELQHPQVVRLYEAGEHDGRLYYTTELAAGVSLRQLLESRHDAGRDFSVDETALIVDQIAEALDCAHERGLYHGALKPENVLFTRDGVKVIEFGRAALLAPEAWISLAERHGAADYLAPEHGGGAPLSVRSDVYSLGVLMYELFTGVVPGANPPLASDANPAVPLHVEVLLQRCLEANPRQRPESVAVVRRALLEALRDECDEMTDDEWLDESSPGLDTSSDSLSFDTSGDAIAGSGASGTGESSDASLSDEFSAADSGERFVETPARKPKPRWMFWKSDKKSVESA